ncbi:transcription factor bHLH36 [Prunus yedoensis var. nudiflora]|uniref:Transcription factor bHLH36 n=1 Tax=Prunus yedoensis var. nudiflora TaxID=2094558 RepID=A0A315AI89_PRUYE|nr:transcription factor bHLH36 [Prunus yedoensis var. nudiflora]
MGSLAANLEERDHQIQMDHNQGSQSSSTKVERRVIEKNRRNQMKVLYSKLNSLLPRQNSQEPLTLPDQIDEAINYIKSLESKLQKSKEKRDSLKEKRKRSHTACTNFDGMRSSKPPQIQVHEMGSTLEVVLISGLDNYQVMFNEIIRILHDEQADVVHASLSTLGDSIFHVIRAEMGKSMLDFGAAKITEKLGRFVNGSTSDEELQREYLWDFEIYPETIWDQF